MLIAADASLIVDTRRPVDLLCAFEHLATFEAGAPPEVILVGTCKLNDVYRLAVGKNNSEWVKIFANGGSVMVRIVALGDNQAEINRWANIHMRALPSIPRCNLHGLKLRGWSRAIKCENTGEVFATQSAACEALGLDGGSLSKHLSGKSAHVDGRIFRYVVEGDQLK